MSCELIDSEWTDYLDNALPLRERLEMDAHLRVCEDCSVQLSALQQVDRRLRVECGAILQSIEQSGMVPEPSIAKLLAVLKEGAAVATPKGTHERLWRVGWVLALLCGTHTAAKIISVAQTHAEIPANLPPSEQKWQAFLHRLAFLTTEICGRSAGELISAVGK
jgi:hypothetical protein